MIAEISPQTSFDLFIAAKEFKSISDPPAYSYLDASMFARVCAAELQSPITKITAVGDICISMIMSEGDRSGHFAHVRIFPEGPPRHSVECHYDSGRSIYWPRQALTEIEGRALLLDLKQITGGRAAA
jgi:hypothetical protein